MYPTHFPFLFRLLCCVEKGSIEKQPISYQWRGRNGDNYWKLIIQLVNNENQEVINDYLMSLKIANYSKESLITYRSFLQKFFKERKEAFSTLTSNQIQQWFIQYEKGFKEWTLKNHLTALSSFYNFCVEEGYVERSPIKSRMFPRLLKSLPSLFSTINNMGVICFCIYFSSFTRHLYPFINPLKFSSSRFFIKV